MSGKTPENFSNTFFEKELKPWLPDQILDFHTHIWEPDHWIGYKPGTDLSDNTALAPEALREYQKYMATTITYPAEELRRDGVFEIKGKVLEIAKRLDVSEKTVYRYLKTE